MATYTLSFNVQGFASDTLPKLLVKYGGYKLGTPVVSSDLSTLTYTIDTDDKAFASSDLIFGFIKDGAAEASRQIVISNIVINGNVISTSGFTNQYGSPDITSDQIVLDSGETALQNVHDVISETPEYYNAPVTTDPSPTDPSPVTYATINGDAGNNKLWGTDAADTINGNDGNDKIYARAGNDVVSGGNGNDYIAGEDGNDTLYGNAGDDILYGGTGNDTLRGDIGNDRLFGQDGDDYLYGDDGNDVMYGGAGIDRMYGGTGDDRMGGDAGNDIMYGNDGADQMFGGDGNDTMYGGTGNDRMVGNAGDDIMYGEDDDDNMDGQDGNDRMYGGNGSDTVDGELGDDTIDGGAGNDYLIGGQGSDIITGGTGDDIIHGGGIASWDQLQFRENSAWGSDQVWFSEQTQSFYMIVTSPETWTNANAAAQAATLNGASGHLVTITSARESEIIYNWGLGVGANSTNRLWLGATDVVQDQTWRWVGGPEDGLQFSQAGTATNSMYNNWGSGQPNNSSGPQQYATFWYNGTDTWDDRYSSDSYYYVIEWEAEIVSPDYSANTLSGGDGNDVIYGGSGIDTIYGGNDNDQLFGNDGNDIMYGGAGNDLVAGGAGNDTLYGEDGNDFVYGQGGNDTIYGGNGNDLIDGGAGTDHLTYVNATAAISINLSLTTSQNTGGAGWDTISNIENLTGSALNDTLTGNSGNNVIHGGNGNDAINGGAGNDQLFGDAGNDTLTGGAGNDAIDGGAGTNTVIFSGNWADYNVSLSGSTYTVTDLRSGGPDGTDTVMNVQNFTFADGARDTSNVLSPVSDTITGTSGNDNLYSTSIPAGSNSYIEAILNNNPYPVASNNGTQELLYNPTTGNFYQFVREYVDLATVQNHINAAPINGITGHLVTFDNAAEINWVINNLGAEYGSGPTFPGSALVADSITGDAQQTVLNSNGTLTASGGTYIPYIVEWEGDDILGANNAPGPGQTAVLIGGDGNDNLYGGAGQDTFVFEGAITAGNRDTVFDFDTADGDTLDISDILSDQGINVNAGNIGNYVQVDQYNGLRVDVTGSGQFWSGGNPVATFSGDTHLDTAANMLANGLLIV